MTGPIEVSAHALPDGSVIGPDLRVIAQVNPFVPLAGEPVTLDFTPPAAGQVAEERDHAAGIARQLTGAVRHYSSNRPRSLQRKIGPSEVGSPCTRRLGYKLAGVEPVNTSGGDPWASFVGTATHAELENVFQVISAQGWATEVRVQVDDELELSGSCDLIRLFGGVTVIDHKVIGTTSMRKYRTGGPSQQYRWQCHLYAHGLVLAGVPVEWVAIAFWPRSGRLADLHVWAERYDQSIAEAGLQRLATLRQLVAVGGRAVLPQLDTAEHYCDSCDFYRPGSADLTTACAGAH